MLFLCSSLSLKAIYRIKSLNFIQRLVNSEVLFKIHELTHYMCNIELYESYLVNRISDTGQVLCFGSAEQKCQEISPSRVCDGH